MVVEFKLSDTVDLPPKITQHCIDGLFLIIAPDIPTWIVLTKDEYKIYESLEKKNTIEQSLIQAMEKYNLSEVEARNIMKNVLYKIEENKFYNSTQSEIMDDAENIKKNVHVFITHKCNLHCPYCYVSAGKPLENELSVSEWKKAFDRLYEVAPNAEITFSGGEPLTKEGIFEILKYTYELGFENVLFTNGILINKDNIKFLKDYVSLIQISLDGLSAKTHNITRGGFKEILDSIDLIIGNEINLDLAINILPHNVDEITDKLIGFIENLSYDRLHIRLNYHIDREGFAVNLGDEYFNIYENNKEKIKKLVSELVRKGIYNNPLERVRFKRLRNCGIGLSFGIDSNGDIYPCDRLYKSYGNILDSDLRKISKKFSLLNRITETDNMEFCKDCDLKYICNGGCRIDNIKTTGSYLIPPCSDDYKLYFYEKLVFGV